MADSPESVDTAADAMPSGERYIVETGLRLSQSMLWAAQRRYFVRLGIDAWRHAQVPYYVTNNPALARGYAETVLGHLRDLAGSGVVPSGAAPFTLIELGAGGGRFAFLFLQAFSEILALSPLAGTPFRYVMTDIAEANIDFWRAHPALVPYVQARQLDFARFDAERDDRLQLLESGVTLAPAEGAMPLVVLANYVFDGLAQDAFGIRGGALLDCLVTIESDRAEIDPGDPELLGHLHCDFVEHPLDGPAYAEEPQFDAVLRRYAETLGDCSLLFPCAALRCIERLAGLAGGRLLVVSGDRGEAQEADLPSGLAPRLAKHGSVSFPVNYHAIGAWVEARGGLNLKTSYRHGSLAVSALLLGHDPEGCVETRLAFQTAIEQRGPDDFFTLRWGMMPHYAALELGHLLALLRSSGWDPKLVGDCAPTIWDRLGTANDVQRRELVKLIGRSWTRYYHLGEAQDLAFEFGMLLYGLGAYDLALARFTDSRRLYGDDPRTFWNAGLCHAALGQAAEAGRCLVEAFRLQPGFAVPHAIVGKHGEASQAE